MMETKKVGQLIAEHDEKDIGFEDDIRAYSIEIMKAQFKEAQLHAHEGSKREPYINKDFYIVLFPLNERLLHNTPKYWIGARLSCPSPAYKQIVFKYHHISGELEYLWTMPSMKTYYRLWKDRAQYLQSTNLEVKRMVQLVVMDRTGELEKWIIKENGNKEDALIYVNRNEYNAQG